MELMTRLPRVLCPGSPPLHSRFRLCSSRGYVDRSLLLPRSPSSHTLPFLVPARVARPSRHPCSDPFVAPGPHAALSAAALPPQGCSVGPPPWSSPQTLEAPSLRGPHSCCAVSSRWASTSPPAAPTSPSSPPPGTFRLAPTPAPMCCHCPLPTRPPLVPGEEAGLPCSPICPRDLRHQAPCVLHPRHLWGPARPLPGPGCHPSPLLQARQAQPGHGQTQPPTPHCGRPSPITVTP